MHIKDSYTMKKYISKVFSVISVLLVLTACTKNYDKMNISPNALTSAPYGALLTSSIITAARYCIEPAENPWCRYHVRDVYVQNDRYSIDGSLTSFGDYNGILKDLQLVIQKADAVGNKNAVAAAMILKAYTFQITTDRFGDIPYSEALKADATPAIIFPKYDTQQSIYMDLIDQLKTANNMIDPIATAPAGDALFKGDMMQWKSFANSLLLRIYMRMSNVDPGTAKAGIEDVIANPSTYPIISSNDQNIVFHWIPGDATYRSPFWKNPTRYAAEESVVSKQIIDYLTDRKDSRLTVYAAPALNSGLYVGLEAGTLGYSTPDLSLYGTKWFMSEDSPSTMFTYSETLFIIAEAALNGWNVGMTAKDAYEAAITASFTQYSLTVPAGYFSDPINDFNGATPQRELIGVQKWLALYPDGTQGWAEVRRTGFPVYVATTEPVGTFFPGDGVIKRYPYPNTEAINNTASLNAALAAQPGIVKTKFGKGVWWDVN